MSTRVSITATLLAAVLAAAALYAGCSVKFDVTPDDVDWRINVKDLPSQAKKIKVELYDLRTLMRDQKYVHSLDYDETYGYSVKGMQRISGATGDTFEEVGLYPHWSTTLPTSGGELVRPVYLRTDLLGELFVHLVVLDELGKPFSHACLCRRAEGAGDFRIKQGQVVDMPGRSKAENATLYNSLCEAYGKENCFSCGDLRLDGTREPTPNLPCVVADALLDGDSVDTDDAADPDPDLADTDAEGDLATDPDPGAEDGDIVTDGDPDPDQDSAVETDPSDPDIDAADDIPVDDNKDYPPGERFTVQAEAAVQTSRCQPVNAVSTIDASYNSKFTGDIVLLGGDAAAAAELAAGDKLVFEFDVAVGGLYAIKVWPVYNWFSGKVNVILDDTVTLTSTPLDLFRSKSECSSPRCDQMAFPYMPHKSSGEILKESGVYLSQGTHSVTMIVTGKNSSSSGYAVGLDLLDFYPPF